MLRQHVKSLTQARAHVPGVTPKNVTPPGFKSFDDFQSWASAYGSTDIAKDVGTGTVGLAAAATSIAASAVRTVSEMSTAMYRFGRDTQEAFRSVDRRKSERLFPVGRITSNHLASFDGVVMCDPTKAGFSVRLPVATVEDSGKVVVIKNVTSSTNAVTVTAGTARIDGAVSVTLATALGVTRFWFDGSAWWTI